MSFQPILRVSNRAEISVVIPTCHRPDLVVRAVASVLAQDFTKLEVLVVIDGDDPATRNALASIFDPRLRIIDLAVNVGAAEARNIGVRAAQSEWVAFLDDDDEWLPKKLFRQIVAARRSTALWPVVSSRMIVNTPSRAMLRPLRPYDSRKPISDFLFCRDGIQAGSFAMQTSTLMARREMLLILPFRDGLERHQDWDWVLRAQRMLGVEFSVIGEPLVIFHTGDMRESVSRSLDWRFSLEWSREMRPNFSAKAYSWFLAAECASRAAKSRAGIAVYAEIARRFFIHGRPALRSTAMLLAFLALPPHWRESARRIVRKKQPAQQPKTVPTTIGMEV